MSALKLKKSCFSTDLFANHPLPWSTSANSSAQSLFRLQVRVSWKNRRNKFRIIGTIYYLLTIDGLLKHLRSVFEQHDRYIPPVPIKMTDKVAAKCTRSTSSSKESDGSMTIADLARMMQTQFSESQRSAKEGMEKMREALTTSLTARMDKLETEIRADLVKLREDNNRTFDEIRASIDQTVFDTAQALDRASRTNDLIVSGVPYVHGENLLNYFSSWCRALGYANNFVPLVDMRRLVKGSASDGMVYIILIQFAITTQRNEFYGRYMKSRSLSLSQIGLSSNKRIYVNENIGPATRTIRAKALALKKSGMLSSVFTKDGIVYVRKKANDRDEAVMTEDVLDLIGKR